MVLMVLYSLEDKHKSYTPLHYTPTHTRAHKLIDSTVHHTQYPPTYRSI